MNEMMQRVAERRANRESWQSIAKDYGLGRNALVVRARREEDFPRELLASVRPVRATAEDLQQMVDEGLTDRQIADRLGIKEWTNVTKLRNRRGVYRTTEEQRDKVSNAISPEKLALVKSYVDEGYPVNAICEIVGVSHQTVKRYFPDAGLSKEEVGKLQSMSLKLGRIAA